MEKVSDGIMLLAGESYMQDSQGRMVPLSLVKPVDQTRDQLVRSIINKALAMEKLLTGFRKAAMNDIKAFVDLSAEQYGVKMGGDKGNITIPSFDGTLRVVIAVGEILAFDERLQAAKAIIDELLREWSTGARPELIALVNDAFQVDKAGRINSKRILGLRKIDMPDPRWKKAMDAISDSIQVSATKEYIRIYRRENDEWVPINLHSPAA